jgi:hypothetical protein
MGRPGAYETEPLDDGSSVFRTFESARFTFYADCDPQTPSGPLNNSRRITQGASGTGRTRCGNFLRLAAQRLLRWTMRPSPLSSVERSPSPAWVLISLKFRVITHRSSPGLTNSLIYLTG